jgi:hypothetical protein
MGTKLAMEGTEHLLDSVEIGEDVVVGITRAVEISTISRIHNKTSTLQLTTRLTTPPALTPVPVRKPHLRPHRLTDWCRNS